MCRFTSSAEERGDVRRAEKAEKMPPSSTTQSQIVQGDCFPHDHAKVFVLLTWAAMALHASETFIQLACGQSVRLIILTTASSGSTCRTKSIPPPSQEL